MAITQLTSYAAKSVGTTVSAVFTAQATVQTTLIGLCFANTTAAPVTASAYITRGGVSVYIIKGGVVPAGGSLVAVGGDQKLCLIAGDVVNVVSSAATSLDVIASAIITGESAAASQPVIDASGTVPLTNGSLSFNFSSGLRLPTSTALDFGAGNFTIEFWLNTNGFTNQTTYCTIIDGAGNNVSTYVGLGINNGGTATKVSFQAAGASGTIVGATTVTQTGWRHIACVKSGANGYIFVDGVLDATTAAWGGVTTAFVSGGALGRSAFGTGGNTDNTYGGLLADVRITKGVARYTANFTKPTAPVTSDANTALLLSVVNSSAAFTDSSSNAFVVTALNGTPTFNASRPYV